MRFGHGSHFYLISRLKSLQLPVRKTVRCSALPQEHWKLSPNSSFSLFLFSLWLPSFCGSSLGEEGRLCLLQAARVSCACQSDKCRLVCPESPCNCHLSFSNQNICTSGVAACWLCAFTALTFPQPKLIAAAIAG